MSASTWIQNELRQQGVAFEEVHHLDSYTAQGVAQREHVSGHHVAKVVVAMADGQPIELVLPASRRVVLEQVRDLLGARELRLATEEELREHFTDCDLGAIPALRHWRGVDVIMDASMRVDGDILFQAGTHRDAVRMRFDDWFHMVNPRVESFSSLFLCTPRDDMYDRWEDDEF